MYYVAEGKSVSSKKGILGPHKEIRVKDINSTDESKGKENLEILIKKGLVYEADKPIENAAEKAKALQNADLGEQADLKTELKKASTEKVALVSELDSCRTNLGEAKEEISKLTDKLKEAGDSESLDAEKKAHAETSKIAEESLDAEQKAHGETSDKLNKVEESLGEEVKAHNITKAELKKVSKELKEAKNK